MTSNSNQAKIKAWKILLAKAKRKIEEYLKANHDNTYVGYKNHGYIFCTRSGQPHNIGHLNRSFK
mgnify:CR=1 FL=1